MSVWGTASATARKAWLSKATASKLEELANAVQLRKTLETSLSLDDTLKETLTAANKNHLEARDAVTKLKQLLESAGGTAAGTWAELTSVPPFEFP